MSPSCTRSERRAPNRTARSFAILCAALACVSARAHAQQAPPTRKAPPVAAAAANAANAAAVYTAAQATRGEKVFGANCVACHARRDMSSPDFRLKWNGRSVFDLYERIATTMPESDPGALAPSEYADIVAYLLRSNGMPDGKTALVAGAALRQQKLVLSAPR